MVTFSAGAKPFACGLWLQLGRGITKRVAEREMKTSAETRTAEECVEYPSFRLSLWLGMTGLAVPRETEPARGLERNQAVQKTPQRRKGRNEEKREKETR